MISFKTISIEENKSLKPFSAFYVGGESRYYCNIQNTQQIVDVFNFIESKKIPFTILGGGSNMVISDNIFQGITLHINIPGFEYSESEKQILLKIGTGENWDKVVAKTVKDQLWGLENLSHIPGNTGGLAVQNVGAYGQEAKNLIQEVEVYDTQDGIIKKFSCEECKFGYRKSIFNTQEKGRFIILYITLQLQKTPNPILTYRDLQVAFQDRYPKTITLDEIRNTIIEIRDKKIPLPSVIPNSGSFFKNILLTESEYSKFYQKLSENFSRDVLEKIEYFAQKLRTSEGIKIPTAYVIDICNIGGMKEGGAKILEKNVLIMVNYNREARSKDILTLMQKIRKIVYAKTGVLIYPEPNLIHFSQEELATYFTI